jgi:hypothetical protein
MGRFMRLSRGFLSDHQSIFRLNLMGGKFAIYKGLQRPLVFRSFKGKFIYWGVGSLLAGLVLGALTMSLINMWLGAIVLAGSKSSWFSLGSSFADKQSFSHIKSRLVISSMFMIVCFIGLSAYLMYKSGHISKPAPIGYLR